ncbi:peptidylprolyl isomerase [Nafulsella turpanensis]|uniref:peptidylprolyl isomerase n=1 Tax=Nafulsella turpanensis TaxID=1265690 RepID=UPI00034788A2|nr:peptidylprolyl isomerase [Nafulsella turpanensis]
MRKKYLLWFAGLSLLSLSCKSTEQSSPAGALSTPEPVLFSVQSEPTTLQEFLYVYNKNNFSRDTVANPADDLREYLDLYINFKLKVQEAKEAGMHTEQAFIDELEGYKKQLAKPYLTESAVTEKLVREAYERLGTEVNASHILLGVKPNAVPADTLAAYKKIMKLREQIMNGEDFATLARKHSEDPSASINGGNLGYFTALQMVYPFENAAYNTAEGKVSMPVRTNFGYHLVKVHDKRPSQGKVKVAHIMIRTPETASPEEVNRAKEKAEEIYKKLQKGGDWAQLAAQFSEDRSTKSNGGELEWFSTGNMVPSFEEAAFALEEKGEISEPVRTPYGWHIIRLIDTEQIPPFEEMKGELQARISRDSRAQLQEAALLARLSKENKLQENNQNLKALLEKAGTELMAGNYAPDSTEAAKVLFSLQDKAYTVADFTAWLKKHGREGSNPSPQSYLQKLYEQWQKEELLAYEEAHLAEKYDDYRLLVQEYHDGILLFQLMDEKVWTKALEDTAGLKAFFQARRDQYQWGERVEGTVYSASDKEVLRKVEKMMGQSPYLVKKVPLAWEAGTKNALAGKVVQVLDQLVNELRQDSTALLEIEIPKARAAAVQHIGKHLQALDLGKERYTFRTVSGNEATASLLTQSPAALEEQFNTESALALQVTQGPFEKGDHPVVDAVSWEPGTHQLEKGGRVYLVEIRSILPPAPKKLDEVRGQVISDYQEYLEKQWVHTLRAKYAVEVNEEVLEQTLENIETK